VVTPTFAKIYNESKEVKNNNSPINDYDVNEFRGDAIIGYIVVTQIIKKDQVGKMDKSKQKLVSNDRLSKIFDLLNFDKFVYTQPN
jgi:dsRNA-specific ribonuclease